MIERRATAVADHSEPSAAFGEAIRQAQGYYLMVDAIFSVLLPGTRDEIASLWNEITDAADAGNFERARDSTRRLRKVLGANEQNILARPVDQAATRKLLRSVTSIGERVDVSQWFAGVKPWSPHLSRHSRTSEPPWSADHVILAVESLCKPAFGDDSCDSIESTLRSLVSAAEECQAANFSAELDSIQHALFH